MAGDQEEKNITITKSQVGAVGDNVTISGGLHFHSHGTRRDEEKQSPKAETHPPAAPEHSRHPDDPSRSGENRPRVFISYARKDKDQARRLFKDLQNAGAVPWMDEENLLPGQNWKTVINRVVRESDFFIALISTHSVSKRGYVQAELKKAIAVLEEFPADGIFVIPARLEDCEITYETLKKIHQVDLFLGWNKGVDRILKVILSEKSETADPPSTPEPRPQASLNHFLQPGGTMDVDSRFYIVRQADKDVLEGVSRHRGLVTVQGPQQTGKSSLLIRIYVEACKPESPFRPVMVDFQSLAQEQFESLDNTWQAILTAMDIQLGINTYGDNNWNSKANYDRNITDFLNRFVFTEDDTPVLICLDEVNRVFSTPIRTDFFSSVRAFFNRGAYDSTWRKIRWLLSTSSEPRFFIKDLNQSPFNVGTTVLLNTFTSDEIMEFASHYGFNQNPALYDRIMDYVGGRPFLVHLVLHHLALAPGNEAILFNPVTAGGGLFQKHLDHYVMKFQDEPELVAEMKQVIAGRGCNDLRIADRLASAGLVKQDENGKVSCSCELYEVYLGRRL